MQTAVVGEALKIKIDINNNPIIKNVCIDMRIKFPIVNIILPNSGKGLCTWVRDKDYPIVAKKGPINDNLLSPKSLKNQQCSCIVKFFFEWYQIKNQNRLFLILGICICSHYFHLALFQEISCCYLCSQL